jgi:hypothetical protein
MTQMAPWAWRFFRAVSASSGIGGISNPECRVPSKSVEINLIGDTMIECRVQNAAPAQLFSAAERIKLINVRAC